MLLLELGMFPSCGVLTWGVGTRLGSVFEGPPWELMVSGAGDMGKLL